MRWRPSSRQLSPQAPWLPERRITRCVLFSAELCCSRCRRRTTSMSVRFLGRRVYLGLVVVLCSARHAGQSTAAATVCEALAVPLRTLQRWRRWWREDFMQTPLWQAMCAHFMPPVSAQGRRVICSHALPAAGRGAAPFAVLSGAAHGARAHAARGALSSRRGCRSPPNPRLRSLHSQWRHHPGAPEPGVLLNTPTDPRNAIAGRGCASRSSALAGRTARAGRGARRTGHARRPHLAPSHQRPGRTLRAVDDRALVLRRAQRRRPDRGAARPATPRAASRA